MLREEAPEGLAVKVSGGIPHAGRRPRHADSWCLAAWHELQRRRVFMKEAEGGGLQE